MADPPAASLAVGIPHSPPLEVELRLYPGIHTKI